MSTEAEPTNGSAPSALSGIEAIIAAATPQERSTKICVRGHLRAQYEDLERELKDAEAREDGADLSELAERVRAAADEVERSMVPFRFRSIGAAWRALYLKHSDDQDSIVDVQVYAREAVAATASSPKMTPEQAQQLFDVISQGDIDTLFNTAVLANVGNTVDIPKSQRALRILKLKGSDAN